jgi:anti-sigma factor (TIGR02949 family)
MSMTCRDVEAQLTPFVDGELPEAAAAPVAAHLEACGGCRRMAQLERVGRRVVQDRASQLATPAPASLRAAVRRAAPAPRRRFRLGWIAASAAATVIVAVGLVAVAGVIRPVPVFAAQATLDHLKCIRLGPSTASSDAKAIEASWRALQGWDPHVPTGQQGARLELLGYRRCVITEGRMAHLLYQRGGEIVSLFVLPDGPKVGHAELEMFGQEEVLWTSHGHTYALVGRGDRAALAAVGASLERELAAGSTPAGSGN